MRNEINNSGLYADLCGVCTAMFNHVYLMLVIRTEAAVANRNARQQQSRVAYYEQTPNIANEIRKLLLFFSC